MAMCYPVTYNKKLMQLVPCNKGDKTKWRDLEHLRDVPGAGLVLGDLGKGSRKHGFVLVWMLSEKD